MKNMRHASLLLFVMYVYLALFRLGLKRARGQPQADVTSRVVSAPRGVAIIDLRLKCP